MFADDSFVSPSTSWVPWRFWSQKGAQSGSNGPFVPNNETWIVTAIDVFYYGNASNPSISFMTLAPFATFFNWRPQTSSIQSFFWRGFMILQPGDQILDEISDMTADFYVNGWRTGTLGWPPTD